MRPLRLLAALALVALPLSAAQASWFTGSAPPDPTTLTGTGTVESSLPPIGHVWTVMLENSDFLVTFGGGQSTNPYIAKELPAKGALVVNYFGTGHNSLDNYLTMISGQAPNLPTKGDCQDASVLGGAAGIHFDADGQAIPNDAAPSAVPPSIGTMGCTYPKSVPTLIDQLDAKNISWKGYMEDVDASPATKRNTCQFAGSLPKAVQDQTTAKKVDLFARKHDPFVYFHSITDRQAYCDARDVAQPALETDLLKVSTTPQFSFLTPNLCNDAHDGNTPGGTCSDGGAGGLPRADSWAKVWIPKILNSPAFKKDGLLILTVDEGTEPTSCCQEPRGPNLPLNTDNGTFQIGTAANLGTSVGRGGGQIGTVMISPFITPGTVDTTGMYNHYSYLRSIEDIFKIGATAAIPGSDGKGHLGYAGSNAGSASVVHYGHDIFTAVPTASGTATQRRRQPA